MARKAKPPAGKSVEALRHEEAQRRNIPTAEYQSVIQKEAEQPLRVAGEGVPGHGAGWATLHRSATSADTP